MLEAGRVVRAIAGHDKDRFYVVITAEQDRICIADGKRRKLAKPKAKNPLHIRVTNTVLDLSTVETDKKLREALWRFNEAGKEEGIDLG